MKYLHGGFGRKKESEKKFVVCIIIMQQIVVNEECGEREGETMVHLNTEHFNIYVFIPPSYYKYHIHVVTILIIYVHHEI